MRLVMRVLFVECALTWAMLLAGYVRLATLIWPVATAGLRGRDWRIGLGLLVGLPIAAGWPVMFLAPSLARATHGDWLNLAIPWWLVIGAGGLVTLVALLNSAGSQAEGEVSCQCGACVAYSAR